MEGKIGLLFWYTMTELNQSLLEQLQRTRSIRKPLHCTNSIYDIACCSKGVSILYILHCKYSSNTKEQDRIKDSYILTYTVVTKRLQSWWYSRKKWKRLKIFPQPHENHCLKALKRFPLANFENFWQFDILGGFPSHHDCCLLNVSWHKSYMLANK